MTLQPEGLLDSAEEETAIRIVGQGLQLRVQPGFRTPPPDFVDDLESSRPKDQFFAGSILPQAALPIPAPR